MAPQEELFVEFTEDRRLSTDCHGKETRSKKTFLKRLMFQEVLCRFGKGFSQGSKKCT